MIIEKPMVLSEGAIRSGRPHTKSDNRVAELDQTESKKPIKKVKNVIGITACLRRCSIAVSYEDKAFCVNENIDAAANLAFLLQQMIQENGIDVTKIDGIITASGPGSFTGIRVAQGLAKGLALGIGCLSASVDYFDVIDFLASENIVKRKDIEKTDSCLKKSSSTDLITKLIVIKSEKDQAYFKKIIADSDENLMGVSSYDKIFEESRLTKANSPIVLLGDAIHEVSEHIPPAIASEIVFSDPIFDFRDAKYLLHFVDHLSDSSHIEPLYINASSQTKNF